MTGVERPILLGSTDMPGYRTALNARIYANTSTGRVTITTEPRENADTGCAVYNCPADGCCREHLMAILERMR